MKNEDTSISNLVRIDNINDTIRRYKEEYRMPTENISDGYHTFGELYHHRALLFASVLCMPEINKCAWKSKKHYDNDKDPMYDGMFIVGFTTELDGKKYEASYHYDIDPYWDKYFGHVKEIDHAPKFSGYTPEDSIQTIYAVASYWFTVHESERLWYYDDQIKKCAEAAMKTPINTEESTTDDKEANKKVTDVVIDSETGRASFYNSEKEKITELSKEEVHKIAEKYDGTPTNAAGGGWYPVYGGWGGNGTRGSIILFAGEEDNKPMPVYKFRKVKVHGSGIYSHLVLHRNSDGDYYFTNERK